MHLWTYSGGGHIGRDNSLVLFHTVNVSRAVVKLRSTVKGNSRGQNTRDENNIPRAKDRWLGFLTFCWFVCLQGAARILGDI